MKRFEMTIAGLMAVLSMMGADVNRHIQEACWQSLVRFMPYAEHLYVDAGVNSRGDSVGYFRAWSAGQSNEDGVRTNADMAMVMAFVASRSGERGAVSDADRWRKMALRALRYAYSTHRSNRLMTCTDGKYWGSAPVDDGFRDECHQWESSLWTLSVALAHRFVGSDDAHDGEYVFNMVTSEADFQLTRDVPTGFRGDTKAEENGWEANVLACAWSSYPTEKNAPHWLEAMHRYGFNCYTVAADAADTTMVEGRRASQWYAGQNLYDDFTLQNHNYFHTSYQNVVMQEQAESIVALHSLSAKPIASIPQTLTWHWTEVWNDVLAQLALADGELAMPNGNDWSMFLYDQLPAYAAMATIRQNADALMLELRCLQSLLDRQNTTADGSYMLNPDIGPRRMGVTAHRVMMTWLLHELFPAQEAPSAWEDFARRHAQAKVFDSQSIVRGMTDSRFTCFSWSEGLHNCTGIIVPNAVADTKIMIPYKRDFGGNLIGLPAEMVEPPVIEARGSEWIAHAGGRYPYCIWSTAGNAVIVLGCPVFMALSMDPFTSEERDVQIADGWVNIDGSIGIVGGRNVQLGRWQLVNSIYTSVLSSPEKADAVIYYNNVSAEQTAQLAAQMHTERRGNTITATVYDPDGTRYRIAFDTQNNTVKRE